MNNKTKNGEKAAVAETQTQGGAAEERKEKKKTP